MFIPVWQARRVRLQEAGSEWPTQMWMASHLQWASDAHSTDAYVPLLLTTWYPLCSSGSDQWKMAERKLFNKGIAIYKKDFFLVQKLVSRGKQRVLWITYPVPRWQGACPVSLSSGPIAATIR